MNCIHHPERDAVATCGSCGGGVCEFCKTVVDGIIYCPPCVDKMLASPGKASSTTPQSPGAPMGKPSATDPYAAMFAQPPAASPAVPPAASQATPYKARAEASQTAPYAARSAGAPALAGEVVEGGSMVSAFWMFIVLACGGLVLGGVFMPWASVTWWIFTDSASGWDLVSSDALIGVTYIEPYLLITGAAIMMACALPAIVLALTSAESQDTVRTLAKVSSFGAGLAFGVIVWAIVDVIGEPEFSNIAYGVWIILVAAIVGLVASAFMSRWGGGQSRFYVSD